MDNYICESTIISTKKCNSCGEVKELRDFYKQSTGSDGYRAKCKKCMNKESTEYQKTDKGRKSTNTASSKYRRTEKGKKVDASRYWNNPEKVRSRANVAYHVGQGHVEKQPCYVCGDNDAEAHHEDYGKPLDIQWLCKNHHNELHRKGKDDRND